MTLSLLQVGKPTYNTCCCNGCISVCTDSAAATLIAAMIVKCMRQRPLRACAAFEGAPEEVDITMFDANSPDAESIGRAAAELVAKVCACLPLSP